MRRVIFAILTAVVVCACSSIDCPLNNAVYSKYVLKGDVGLMEKMLTVTTQKTDGTDSLVLLNLLANFTEFELPMSYANETDVLIFEITDSNAVTLTDTVRVAKTNEPHFESVDCSPSYYHTIKDVTWTMNAIDSIIIAKSKVTYDTTGGNLHIYFKSDD